MTVATNDGDDRKLTAYLDGELDEAERAALDARLEADPTLRARLDALRAAADRTRLAFAALLEKAPVADMRTRLDAAVAIVAFATGLGAGRWSAGPGGGLAERDDWRHAVVEYMALYTPESFGEAVSPRLGDELASLSRRLDAPLDVDRLRVDDLSPRRAELLQYDGAPLGQIGYLDGATPVAFCILRDGEPDASLATSSRGGFAVASWAHWGRGFMLIGKIPVERLTTLARSLKEKTG